MPVEPIGSLPGFGDAADKLIMANGDPGILRPHLGDDGRAYVTLGAGTKNERVIAVNAPATLPIDAWKAMDRAVIRGLEMRVRAFADIRAAGLEYNLPNGMAHTILQFQRVYGRQKATLSMDPTRRGEGNKPTTDIGLLPLPVCHVDFDFTARELLASRQGNVPYDDTSAEDAGRRIGEELEALTVGTAGPFSWGGGTIWGYTNFPQRATKTDMPVPDGTNGQAVINAILALRQMLIDDRHPGPYIMYVNSQWEQWLDVDFSAAKGDLTLRQRILALPSITDIRTLESLPTTQHHMLLVEMSAENVRAVVGMEIQTIQWESLGGMMKHYKVMCLQVPQLRADNDGNSGIAHGRTP